MLRREFQYFCPHFFSSPEFNRGAGGNRHIGIRLVRIAPHYCFGLCKTQHTTLALGFSLWGWFIQAQDMRQRLPVVFGGACAVMFPLPHRPR